MDKSRGRIPFADNNYNKDILQLMTLELQPELFKDLNTGTTDLDGININQQWRKGKEAITADI